MKLEPKKSPDFKIKEENYSSSKTTSLDAEVANCAEYMMNAAKCLHKLHLKVTGQGSFAQHSALQGYDEFHDFADSLCEQYQSISERILDIPSKPEVKLATVAEGISYLKELKSEITTLQSKLPYSEIVNLLDTSKEHINSMLYKLKFLS